MSTKSRITSWFRQMSSALETAKNIESSLDNLKGQLHVANAIENAKQIAAIQTELDRLGRDGEKINQMLLQRVKASDLEAVATRLADLAIRLENSDQFFEAWRRRLAQYEHLATLDSFAEEESEGITRQKMTELVEDAKQQYEVCLKNADDLIPNTVIALI